jgi:hypothetical protein
MITSSSKEASVLTLFLDGDIKSVVDSNKKSKLEKRAFTVGGIFTVTHCRTIIDNGKTQI